MEQIIIGLSVLFLGLLFTFAGYQMLRLLIPFWGFLAGFSWTAQVMAVGLGTGFLATLLSWTTAIVVGVLAGIFVYFSYEFAVTVLVASVGYWIVDGLLLWLGLPPGFIVSVSALAFGIAFGVAAIYFRVSKSLLIFISVVGGATTAIAGFMILFGMVPINILGSGLMDAVIGDSFLRTITWIGLLILGSIVQLNNSVNVTIDEFTYESYSPTSPYVGAKGGKAKKDIDDIDHNISD